MLDIHRRDVACRRDEIVDQARGLDLALGVVADLLVQRRADSLGDAAVHLTAHDHRIDQPAEIVGRLNREIAAALAVPDVRERAIAAGAEPATSTPQEFAAMIREETRKWAQVIRTAEIKLQ